VFDNRVLRGIFEPKSKEVKGRWRGLLRNLYSSPHTDQVKNDEMGGAYSMNNGEEERVYVIGGKARGKETARKTRT
jgi:hypothetical protein